MGKVIEVVDLLIIGGGVNGAGIARDAAGRGLSVVLCEQGDLASGTSSAATKLFHGGLRYLEQYAFGLVRKALREREVLLRNMPHISKPMRFVLPHAKGMRPAWLLRAGLFLYDHLASRGGLPATKALNLRNDIAGGPLKAGFVKAFEYSDGWVDDARLVVLNARDAADRGARIMTQTKVVSAQRSNGVWQVETQTGDGERQAHRAKTLVNAGGPWVNIVIEDAIGIKPDEPIRLVRGSHIVTKKLYEHDRAYFFQNADGRVMMTIPYEEDFTIIGTTDMDHKGDPGDAYCTDEEIDYLCRGASEYFTQPIMPSDVIWTYSGVRPLDDEMEGDASKASRDYHIKVEDQNGKLPLISIYGGKITTFRILAEQAVAELAPYVELTGLPWTDHTPLPGGDFEYASKVKLVEDLQAQFPFVEPRDARRMIAAYGALASKVMAGTKSQADLGQDFGAGLYEIEIRWLIEQEWAKCADDVVWRRTKCGLRMSLAQIAALETWMKGAIT
ncbi:MAG: glycerol-3-phosphate dehydrogenase [Paracoccaceae bacterium]